MTDPNAAPHTPDPYPQPTTPPKQSGLAVAACVLGIIGMAFFPFGLIAVIIGIIALNKIADSQQALTGRGMALTGTITGGLGITLIPLLVIVLPALNYTHRGPHRQMKNTTQVRGIVQGMVTYAGGNRERLPGTTSKGYIIYDNGDASTSDTGASGHGATVEARFWLMLDNNNFSGDYIISPAETKTAWTTGPVTSANYSYAMLNIHNGDTNPTSETDRVRPNQTGRAREWRQSINTQAVLIADRARIPTGRIADNYNKIYSIHTSQDDQDWAGSVGRGDGSASFENEDAADTKYGPNSPIEYDRLFSLDQDTTPKTDYDKLTDPHATWDKAANALLGYKSVGYQDPDIASE